MEDPKIDPESLVVLNALDEIRKVDANYADAAEKFLRFPRTGNAERFSDATSDVMNGSFQLIETVLGSDMTTEEKAATLSSALH